MNNHTDCLTDYFSAEVIPVLEKLSAFMLEYNKKVNLTRIVEEREVRVKHFIDCVLPLRLTEIPGGAEIIDVGSGAGFPGVVWKIARPDLSLTLLETAKKRCVYLEELRAHLNLDYRVVNARAEEASHLDCYRESFDVAVMRALACVPACCEYALPFVKAGGKLIAMKGSNAVTDEEIEHARTAARLLSGGIPETIRYSLPAEDVFDGGEAAERNLVIIEKIDSTRPVYPRKRVNITKKPL